MLREIKLKNFKLHKDTKLEFGKITLFIGPNNSGKSSAIHAMQLLKKELVRQGRMAESAKDMFIDIGDGSHADNFAHRGEKSFEIEISGTVPLKNFLSDSEIGIAKKFIVGGGVQVFSSTYTLNDKGFSPKHRIIFEVDYAEDIGHKKYRIYANDYTGTEANNPPKTTVITERGMSFEIFSKHGKIDIGPVRMELKGMQPNSLRYSRLPGVKKDNELLEQEYGVIYKILSSPEHLINSFHFVYPIRGLEWQGYDIEQNKESSNLNLDNISIEKRAKSVANTFIFNRLLEDEIYEKMKEVVDVRFFAEMSTEKKVKLVSKISKEAGIPFLFEGLGAHQMLFMLLPIVFVAKPNETIFIEEPENHLHPKAQYELSKLFTEIAEKQQKQLVMTTHSEHIVFGFLNQVAKKKLKKDDLKIYYFREPEEGEAKVKELKVNEFGQVDGGLPGFFETNLDALIDSLKALDDSN